MDYKELSDFINKLIIEELPSCSPEQIQEKCNDILNKYQTLDDKISFNVAYEIAFHQRLALMNEKCIKFEEKIISEIRKIQPSFMMHFDAIKECYHASKHLSEEFKQTNNNTGIDFDPLIMPKYICPVHTTTNELVNSPLFDICEQFKQFCKSKKNNEYEINSQLSICELTLKFPNSKEYTIKSNFYTSSILLALSEKELKFFEIVDLLKSDKKYISLLIKQLNELKIIKRLGESNILKDNDVFCLNPNFTSSNNVIQLVPILPKPRIDLVAKFEKEEAIKLCIIRQIKLHNRIERNQLLHVVEQILNNSFNIDQDQINCELNKIIGSYISKSIEDGKEIYSLQ